MQRKHAGVFRRTSQKAIPLDCCLDSLGRSLAAIVRAEHGVRIFDVIEREFDDISLVPQIAKDR